METASARAIHDPAADFYIDAMRRLVDSGIPFLVGGAFAFSHYAHVRRDTKDIEVPDEAKVSPAEVKMAERLVDDMTEKWNPKPFKDEYREDLMKMIEKRIKAGMTKTIVSSEEEEEAAPRTEIRDLMPLLKKSLERRGRKGAADEEEEAPRPKRAAAAAKKTVAKAAAARPKKKRTA